MRIFKYKFCLLAIAITGCLHRSPHSTVLAPLSSAYSEGFANESKQPEYLSFLDRLTKSVFKRLEQSGAYRIAPPGTNLLCPFNPAEGQHGYQLRVRVVMLAGDSAVGALEQACQDRSQAEWSAVSYLLRRRDGKWEIEKVLGGQMTHADIIPLPSNTR